MRRRSLVAVAVLTALGAGATTAAAHDDAPAPWFCVAVGPPVEQGYCQYDPLPERLPSVPSP